MSVSLQSSELRVLSYNIHHGRGMDGKVDLPRIAKVIKAANPDIIALQEVDQKVPRSGGIDQAKELAKLLGMHYTFGKAIDLQGGAYGLAVLSKHPITAHQVHKLPGKGEARICLQTTITLPAKSADKKPEKITFASIHLDYKSSATRLPQIKAAHQALSKQKLPVVLAGDFNAWPSSETMKFLEGTWKCITKIEPMLTYPAPAPKVEIDYVLYKNLTVKKAISQVISEPMASDHRPVLAILER